MQPHYSHSSRENATPSSGTSLLASCKGVLPRATFMILVLTVATQHLTYIFKPIQIPPLNDLVTQHLTNFIACV